MTLERKPRKDLSLSGLSAWFGIKHAEDFQVHLCCKGAS